LDYLFLKNKKSKEFTISMTNEFINTSSGEIYVTSLETKYKRFIYEKPIESLGFVKYIVDETRYRKKDSEDFMTWSFAKGFEFYNAIYALKDKAYKDILIEESAYKKPFETVEESFNKLPKLPSVYLLMMQVFDILAFDSFLSFIHCQEDVEKSLKQYMKIEELSNKNIDMSIGENFEHSNFKHNDFYIAYLGESYIYEIFDYYADSSDVIFGDLNSKMRKNKSLYSGKVLVSKEDGDIYHGYMHELIVPIDGSNKVISRKVYKDQI
jgi:hypothetical protein